MEEINYGTTTTTRVTKKKILHKLRRNVNHLREKKIVCITKRTNKNGFQNLIGAIRSTMHFNH